MKSSSTRRVLKSVVGPALGATLGALVAGGCSKEEAAKPAPAPAKAPAPAADATPPPAPADAAPPVPEPADAAPAPAADPPKKGVAPKKTAPKKADEPKQDGKKDSPSTEWYAGSFLDRDIRPMRPARRGTDPDVTALVSGLVGGALRPLA